MSNGDIMNVETSGANVPQDNLGYSGVAASHTMAEHDAGEMEKHRSKINKAARKHGVEPALVAGVISRETRGGAAIRGTQGWGDHGKAWGLMQVDVTPTGGNHKARGGWDSDDHLDQATGILADSIRQVDRKFPHWSKEQKLKGGIAAYNAGGGRVTSYDVDRSTTGGDYANDVVARAQWYKSRGGF